MSVIRIDNIPGQETPQDQDTNIDATGLLDGLNCQAGSPTCSVQIQKGVLTIHLPGDAGDHTARLLMNLQGITHPGVVANVDQDNNPDTVDWVPVTDEFVSAHPEIDYYKVLGKEAGLSSANHLFVPVEKHKKLTNAANKFLERQDITVPNEGEYVLEERESKQEVQTPDLHPSEPQGLNSMDGLLGLYGALAFLAYNRYKDFLFRTRPDHVSFEK